MAAKEEMYSKIIPRRNRQQRTGTIKHGSSLEILLSMGFPKARALLEAFVLGIQEQGLILSDGLCVQQAFNKFGAAVLKPVNVPSALD